MTYQQLITPNPNIPCQPGWCLQYVRQTFDLPAAYPTATAAWEASTSQHRDYDFPAGLWVPVWFSLANEPAGHVALMAPDGAVYSTSDLGNTPHRHPDLADLIRFYAYYGMPLTYLGWTEDVAGYPVMTGGGLAAMGSTITPQAPQEEPLVPNESDRVFWPIDGEGKVSLNELLNSIDRKATAANDRVSLLLEAVGSAVRFTAIDGSSVTLAEQLRSLDAKADRERAENAALRAAVAELTADSDVTPEQINASIKAALSGISITLTTDGK